MLSQIALDANLLLMLLLLLLRGIKILVMKVIIDHVRPDMVEASCCGFS